MYDVMLLLGITVGGGIFILLGFLAIIRKMITGPRKELRNKIKKLEGEIHTLKMKRN
jgi:hypothetical protein